MRSIWLKQRVFENRLKITHVFEYSHTSHTDAHTHITFLFMKTHIVCVYRWEDAKQLVENGRLRLGDATRGLWRCTHTYTHTHTHSHTYTHTHTYAHTHNFMVVSLPHHHHSSLSVSFSLSLSLPLFLYLLLSLSHHHHPSLSLSESEV